MALFGTKCILISLMSVRNIRTNASFAVLRAPSQNLSRSIVAIRCILEIPRRVRPSISLSRESQTLVVSRTFSNSSSAISVDTLSERASSAQLSAVSATYAKSVLMITKEQMGRNARNAR